MVQAFNRDNGQPLSPAVPTVLQGQDVGSGGAGTYAVQLTVNVPQQVNGFITASSPGTPGVNPARVDAIFGSSGPTPCTVTPNPPAPYYAQPNINSLPAGFFSTAQPLPVTGRQLDGIGILWFQIPSGPRGSCLAAGVRHLRCGAELPVPKLEIAFPPLYLIIPKCIFLQHFAEFSTRWSAFARLKTMGGLILSTLWYGPSVLRSTPNSRIPLAM